MPTSMASANMPISAIRQMATNGITVPRRLNCLCRNRMVITPCVWLVAHSLNQRHLYAALLGFGEGCLHGGDPLRGRAVNLLRGREVSGIGIGGSPAVIL